MKTLMTMSVNRLVKYIKETITYYIVTMYMHSFLYRKVIVPYKELKEYVNDECYNTDDIIYISNINFYKYVPRQTKLRLINKKRRNEKID